MLRAQVKCTLCFDDFTEPRKLPCGDTHIFCTKCIFHHIRGHAEDQQFRCPAHHPDCNAMHPVPDNGVDGIREQFPLATDVLDPPEGNVEQGTDKKVFCQEKGHEMKEMVVYCTSHGKLICTQCLTSEHSKCDYSQFEDEVPRQKAFIDELLVKVKKYTNNLDKIIADAKAAYDKSDQDIDEMKKQVEITFQEVVSILTQKKSELLHKIDKIKSERNQEKVTSSQQKQIQNAQKITSSCIGIQKQIALCGILEEATAVKQAWENLYPKKVHSFSWEFSSEEITNQCDDWLGVITSSSKQYGFTRQVDMEPKISYDIHTMGKSDITGIIEIEHTVIFTQWDSCSLYIFNTESMKLLREIKIPGMHSSFGGFVSLINRPSRYIELVISDYKEKCLHFVTLNSEWNLVKRVKKTLLFQPYDISVFQGEASQQIIVTNFTKKMIHTFNKEGVEAETLQLESEHFSSPSCALRIPKGYIIGDESRHRVVWLDDKGNFVREYTGHPDKKINSPQELEMDIHTGNIYIIDFSEHTIHEVDDQGQCVRIVATETDGIKSPLSLHLGASGRLYVGSTSASGHKQIKVFQYYKPSQSECATDNTTHSVNMKICKWK